MLLSSSGGFDGVVQLITVLIIFVLVLFITLYVTRWIAGFQKEQLSGSNMKVVETMRLTPNQFVQIVKLGEQYLAIAVSKEQVTVLTKLDESELKICESENGTVDFGSVLKQFRNAFPAKGNAEITSKDDEE